MVFRFRPPETSTSGHRRAPSRTRGWSGGFFSYQRSTSSTQRRTTAGVWLSMRMRSTSGRSASWSWSSDSTSTSSTRSRRVRWMRSIAFASPPPARMWLSLTRYMSQSANRWFCPPPQSTAYFSRMRSPGVVLRVSRITPPVPSIALTYSRVSVATPESRMRKFSAVRSAVMRLAAEPETVASAAPAGTSCPSLTVDLNFTFGSTSRNVMPAMLMPDTTPGCFATIAARAPTFDGTAFSVVTSPVPTSSESANFTSGRKLSCMPGLTVPAEATLHVARLAAGFDGAAARTRLDRLTAARHRERRADVVDAVPQGSRALELERARGLEHLALELREQPLGVVAQQHRLLLARALAATDRVRHARGLEDLLDRLQDRARR